MPHTQTPVSNTPPLALVIGATGGIGGEVARALLARGWRVRALNRNPKMAAAAMAPSLAAIDWVQGDAMDAASVVAAAQGASLIFHGANPPGYRNWAGTALPMLESSIAAAKAVGARILFPGTVYNFGPETFPLIDETAPQRPRTHKGKIRVAMEQRLAEASHEGVPVLIVRAGDFFSSHSSNSWFGQGLVQAGRPVRLIMDPTRGRAGHGWAYLPDLAETMARLCEKADELGAFEVFHFAGHWLEDGGEIARAIQRACAPRRPMIIPFPWLMVTLLAPIVALFHEMEEMRYLWREPVRLDNRRLLSVLGAEVHTPLDHAVLESLAGLGCLEPAPAKSAAAVPA